MVVDIDYGRIRNARIAVCYSFFSLGFEMGVWAAILPNVKEDHDLNNSTLGGILVAAVFGALLALPIATVVLEKYGSRVSLITASVISALLFPLVGLKSHVAVFIVGVFLLGFGAGWADISMNAQAVLCEKVIGRSIMGLFHSLFAVGGLSGALFAGGMLNAGANSFQVTALNSLFILLPDLVFVWWLLSKEEQKFIEDNLLILREEYNLYQQPLLADRNSLFSPEKENSIHPHSVDIIFTSHSVEKDVDNASESKPLEASPSTISRSPLWNTIPIEELRDNEIEEDKNSKNVIPINYYMLYCISALCFLSYFGQGSIGDWSAIYFTDDLNASALESTYGYVGFELCVAIGTFFSDWFVNTFGRKWLLIWSGLLAGLGLLLVVLALAAHDHTLSLSIAILGFSISGFGLSAVSRIDLIIVG